MIKSYREKDPGGKILRQAVINSFIDLASNPNPLSKDGFKFVVPVLYRSETLYIIALGEKAEKSKMINRTAFMDKIGSWKIEQK